MIDCTLKVSIADLAQPDPAKALELDRRLLAERALCQQERQMMRDVATEVGDVPPPSVVLSRRRYEELHRLEKWQRAFEYAKQSHEP